MRHAAYVALVIGMAVLFGNRVPAQGTTTACRPNGPCLTTSAASYNRCVDLALRRGLNLSKGDRHQFDRFIYDCVAGRVGG